MAAEERPRAREVVAQGANVPPAFIGARTQGWMSAAFREPEPEPEGEREPERERA
jgi:hypothetical protein